MKKQFTRGEWIFQKYSPYDYGVYSIEGSGNDIAIVREMNGEGAANVKLIAAAPDMLEVLSNIYNDRETWGDLFPAQQIKIEETIKKATE